MSNHGMTYEQQSERGELTSSTVLLSLPKRQKEALREYAKRRNWSMNEVVREALKLYMLLRPTEEEA